MDLLELNRVTHRFPGGKSGIFNISLRINSGSFVVLAGPNGSGKTTLLKHLNGLLFPQEGEIWLDGRPLASDLLRARQLVGMVFQDADSQIIGETVFEDVAFGPENLRLTRSEINQRTWKALADVGLEHKADARPHTLSGGEKRRLAIAGVIAMNPKVIVFDEPFANLDYPGSVQVLSHILRLHQNGAAIVITTHELEKVLAHADRLILLQNGSIAADAPPEEIMAQVETYGVRRPCRSRLGLPLESWLNEG